MKKLKRILAIIAIIAAIIAIICAIGTALSGPLFFANIVGLSTEIAATTWLWVAAGCLLIAAVCDSEYTSKKVKAVADVAGEVASGVVGVFNKASTTLLSNPLLWLAGGGLLFLYLVRDDSVPLLQIQGGNNDTENSKQLNSDSTMLQNSETIPDPN